MKIKIKQAYKSINPCEFELPDFSVLTGKNGSGKSHLLQVMSNVALSEIIINGKLARNIKYVDFNGLNPSIQESCNPQSIIPYAMQAWDAYVRIRQQLEQRRSPLLPDKKIEWLDILPHMHTQDTITRQIIEKTIRSSGEKEAEQLTLNDFEDNFEPTILTQSDFFTTHLALIFKSYSLKREENEYNEFRESKSKSVPRPGLNDAEFVKRYGEPPWDVMNSILKDIGIPYEVNKPEDTSRDSTFDFKLIDRHTKLEISSNDLSTGEKVLMSLALAIYSTDANFKKPDLLLIDEPDAGLHPAMSKKMVSILNKHIVQANGIPVVITTHSPTTVIASEGVAVYQVIRGNSIPEKMSVQEAVEILTSDIPFLKISTENRRPVFVENQNDVKYYEQICNILSQREKLPSEPMFISTRNSKHNGSNCTDVIALVKNLSECGNDQIYGIIDRDNNNKNEDRIIVLGGDRYAIENYLLDPLLMGLLFIRERKKEVEYFGVTTFRTYADIRELNEVDAQKIIDKILEDLGLKSDNNVDYELYNGWGLNISSEFNNHQGHSLETLYKNKYPFLNAYHKEHMLKEEMISKVINDYPQFMPMEIVETIRRIV